MHLKHVGLVWGKELLDTIRDRRTLIVMVVVPLLLMPLLVFGPNFLRISQEESKAKQAQSIAIINSQEAPKLVEMIRSDTEDPLRVVDAADPQAALLKGDIAAVLVVPQGFSQSVQSEDSSQKLVIQRDVSNSNSTAAVDKLEKILDSYRRDVVRDRLVQRGIPAEVLDPFSYQSVNVAPEQRVSGFFLSLLLPLFLVLYAAIGGAQTAIDITAGEKERGTLESLLVAPPSRTSFVLGKFLTIFTVSLAATTLSLAGFALSLTFGPQLFPNSQLFDIFKFAIGGSELALLFGMTAIVSAMMSALTFALYIWTRNFKEAQTYTTYMSFLVMIPAFAVSFMDPPTNFQAFLIPIYNATAVIKELLMGEINWTHIAITFASSAIYATIGLILANRMFNNEKVLFRQ
ncbi:ABC transporter permease [Candidatus Acetothermia bacterium]|nr:ABC transporter permease [Candidatus Acetothermia bacterium]MBI3642950.1 ABC transporter permease [Candidatus Acetothermia bacterium]